MGEEKKENDEYIDSKDIIAMMGWGEDGEH